MSDKTPEIGNALGEARDLALRLEGTSVTRVVVAAGETRIEIEREAGAAAPAPMDFAGGGGLGASLAAGGGGLLGGPGARIASGSFAAIGASDRIPILAPLVGTFYAQKQPGTPPFVEVGQVVEAGEVVCIVEAMKLMNEVAAIEKGKVAEICVGDSDWVEFDQVLMYLEPVE